ncbi:sugar phosphate nucleotidyltransferase [Pelagibacteraceae bacterium]|nr:sugar phosphate nucleotidyltransferase [Pelagibacteraceae bacterium]
MIKKNFHKYLIDHNTKTIDSLKKINKLGGRSLIVVSNKKILKGILSSADLRRAILNHSITNEKINKIYNKKPKFIYSDEIKEKINKIFSNVKRFNIIPIIDRKTKKIIDVLDSKKFHSLNIKKKNKKINASVVIMAGGKGTRLMPYTSVLPKPLLPINNKPTIKHIIDRFKEYSVTNFFVTLNYKSEILKTYLKDLSTIIPVISIQEKKPLGTAGSLYLIKNKLKNDFFLTNCDTIINANYYEIFKHHNIKKNDITIIVAVKKFKIPYGVCESTDNNFIMNEKPELKHNVNAGFYIISKKCLKVLKKREYLDFNNFLLKCKKHKMKIGIFRIKEKNWIDVGQMKEYKNNFNKNI